MGELLDALRSTAKAWRGRNPEYSGGVVLIWECSVYGWKNKLRDPQHERPGVYAVDEIGHVFVAEGGNDQDGAKCWVAACDGQALGGCTHKQ